MIESISLFSFAQKSNLIEGIDDYGRHLKHAESLGKFLNYKDLRITRLEKFVKEIEPQAFLRKELNHGAVIGGRLAPPGPISIYKLDELLRNINMREIEPWQAHAEYEYIHPFIDGNGRSGRAVWLWMMVKLYGEERAFRYPFLRYYYYQTLGDYAERKGG